MSEAIEKLAETAWEEIEKAQPWQSKYRNPGEAAVTAILSAINLTPDQAAALMEGRAVCVPREPTIKMQNAGWREIDQQGFSTEDTEVAPIYRAMISAAQKEPD